MSEAGFPKILFTYDYNEEAVNTVRIQHAVICRKNMATWPEVDGEEDIMACGGCSIALPAQHRGLFCGSHCPVLGMNAKIKSLSIDMGLSYLFPMASLVKQSRITPVGFKSILMFLYDRHFGDDVQEIWPNIEADFVYRNRKLKV